MGTSLTDIPITLASQAALLPVTDPVSGPWTMLAVLLFATFVLHLFVMNALVGFALLTLADRLRPVPSSPGLASPSFARESDVLLPKGVAFAVNLGIPPFLFLQTIYSQYIYSSSVLMALWWLAVMMLVMLAYYGFYINMARRGVSDGVRTWALALAVLLLLANAFIFVNNMTLMQNPQAWALYAENSGGTFLNLSEPQLAPRYLHVLLSCLAVGGLCLALPGGASGTGPGEALSEEAATRRNKGLKVFLHATMLQIPVGLWFFMALPKPQRLIFMGGDALATTLFCLSLPLTAAALFFALKQRPRLCAACCGLLIIMMAGMRSLLRSSYLAEAYNPPMRDMDVGPFLLFAVSLAVSALFLAWMVRLYMRHGRDSDAASGPQLTHEDRRNIVLVNETAHAAHDGINDERGEKGARS